MPLSPPTQASQDEHGRLRLPVQDRPDRERRCRKDVPGPALHSGSLPARPRRHHRSGLHDQDGGDKGAEGEAADLGHGGPGALPLHHAELLPQRQRPHPDLRHHLRGLLPLLARVAEGDRAVRQQPGAHHTRREQDRPGGEAGGAETPGSGLRRVPEHGVPGDLGQGVGQRGEALPGPGLRADPGCQTEQAGQQRRGAHAGRGQEHQLPELLQHQLAGPLVAGLIWGSGGTGYPTVCRRGQNTATVDRTPPNPQGAVTRHRVLVLSLLKSAFCRTTTLHQGRPALFN